MIRYISLFSGIGAFEKALDNLGIPYELLAYCEVDKYASKAYSLLHHVPESMNLGDITKVDEKALPTDIDLLTYGFPCQDISIAGNKRGFVNEDGTKTRSGLFFDALILSRRNLWIYSCSSRPAEGQEAHNLQTAGFYTSARRGAGSSPACCTSAANPPAALHSLLAPVRPPRPKAAGPGTGNAWVSFEDLSPA